MEQNIKLGKMLKYQINFCLFRPELSVRQLMMLGKYNLQRVLKTIQIFVQAYKYLG